MPSLRYHQIHSCSCQNNTANTINVGAPLRYWWHWCLGFQCNHPNPPTLPNQTQLLSPPIMVCWQCLRYCRIQYNSCPRHPIPPIQKSSSEWTATTKSDTVTDFRDRRWWCDANTSTTVESAATVAAADPHGCEYLIQPFRNSLNWQALPSRPHNPPLRSTAKLILPLTSYIQLNFFKVD